MGIWDLAHLPEHPSIWLADCMHCKMHLTTPGAALLAKQILFPFILQYQYEFNLFFSTKWLFAQLTHIYYSRTLWLGNKRPAATHSSHFASISSADSSYTVICDAAAVTGSGYFAPTTLATYQAGSRPARDLCLRLSQAVPKQGNTVPDTLLWEVLP